MTDSGIKLNVLPIIGKIIGRIEREGDEELRFFCRDGSAYRMYHRQDCC